MELTVSDYDRIGTSDPIGRVTLGYNRKGPELKHWREMVDNPRRPVIHWHVLQVLLNHLHESDTNMHFLFSLFSLLHPFLLYFVLETNDQLCDCAS